MTQARDRLAQLLGPYLRRHLPHPIENPPDHTFHPQQPLEARGWIVADVLCPLLLGDQHKLGRPADHLRDGGHGGHLAKLGPVQAFQLPDAPSLGAVSIETLALDLGSQRASSRPDRGLAGLGNTGLEHV